MVRNSELPEIGQSSKLLAMRVRSLIEEKDLSQTEIGAIIGRAQSYASLRIKGLKSWTIEELDQLAPILGYRDAFALIAACRPESDSPAPMSGTVVDADDAFIDALAADPERFGVAAHTDPNKEIESETPGE
ncbi:helix-turn-helix domain-containing protein [Bifidobacterium saimiriisciurei]|uniref:HTH cro/C1-type domain-containing protein n=1 Tax=Bifidobacterium saimiriisciurei TaxID=2661627 RepID=A0ABX0CE27_9BIFI|nr:hypothetical protein [Bifidobacterium saimiriisciurei]NEH12441.1 hypothetical protein [Bifidobacterium saimiriisciurei]